MDENFSLAFPLFFQLIIIPPLSYALGSIPWGLVLTRMFTSVDLRKSGSGNIGATNVRRTAGTLLGVCTLVGDVLKGAAPVWWAVHLVGRGTAADGYVALVALCAFLGHLYPVFMRLSGHIARILQHAGCFLALSPSAVIVTLLVFILFVCMTGRVSAGSLTATAFLPLAVWKAIGSVPLTMCAGVIGGWVWWRHRENLRRLAAGTEPKI
ncbi:MAG: glycerol-3-phosphate acyltransferase [Thermodesulfobacteriota bacterium]